MNVNGFATGLDSDQFQARKLMLQYMNFDIIGIAEKGPNDNDRRVHCFQPPKEKVA